MAGERGGKPTTKNDIELARIKERGRTIRFAVGCVSFVFFAGIVAWAAVHITDQPAWLTFTISLLTILFGPTGYVVIMHRRIVRIDAEFRRQQAIDPDTNSLNTSAAIEEGEER